ncbi:MAG TPA: DUF814 domain-containing protein [bacterium (Candidatus Stahlbacteria)]|nr:DUF814 domain-containing protein [Candidatus Stahlbacteria bacterium]
MLSGIILKFLTGDLKIIVGRRLKKVYFKDRVYRFVTRDGSLLVSIDPELPLIAWASLDLDGIEIMRNIWSKRIRSIETIGWDRIVRIGIGGELLNFFLSKKANLKKGEFSLPADDRKDPDVVDDRFDEVRDLISRVKGIDLKLGEFLICQRISPKELIDGIKSGRYRFETDGAILPAQGGRYERINTAAVELFKNYLEERKRREEEKEARRIRRYEDRIRKKIERIGDPERFKKMGDAILTFPNVVSGKKGTVELPDPNNPTKKIMVEVDGRPPQDLAQHYFKRYKKAKRNLEHLKELLKRPLQSKRIRGVKIPYHRFFTRNGLEILVGKNARSNDLITFKISGPKDIFFHVRGYPGSHVILRTMGKKPDRSDIETAASYAVSFSKARGSTWVPVSYALRADIKRGKEPGSVIFRKEKVIFSNPAFSR